MIGKVLLAPSPVTDPEELLLNGPAGPNFEDEDGSGAVRYTTLTDAANRNTVAEH
jgi:hypothetical protein